MKYPQLVSMPSAVSDWLEEQLEARGIDAVVYTRYVLSLLHTHTVDAIYADDDQLAPFRKEVKGSGGNKKRFRRSTTNDKYWRYADAEQLKRSAAVQCLMSASDQNCEVESLVDELCAKLKEVKSDEITNNSLSPPTKPKSKKPKKKPTNQELAEKYYAAFPPLSRTSTSSPSKLFTKWIQKSSPPKKKSNCSNSNRKFSYDSKFFNRDSTSTANEMKNSRTARRKLNFGGRNKYCNFLIKNETKLKSFKPIPAMEDQVLESEMKVNRDDDIMTMYDDLPVDFRQLLNSPTPTSLSYETEMLNLANMRDTGNKGFIPCGTNITSSIWSNDVAENDNKINTALEDGSLDMQFRSISIDNNEKTTNWPSFDVTQQFIEQQSYFDEINKYKSWSNNSANVIGTEGFEDKEKSIQLSCFKLNHNEATSAFKVAKVTTRCHRFNPFSNSNLRHSDGDKDLRTEDLLTSEKSHFKPINEKVEVRNNYVDGATFIINNNLDKVQYKRSESGFMYLETEFGNKKYKKYSELRLEDIPSSESNSPSLADGEEFTLKFTVRENDKACQTDSMDREDLKNEHPIDQIDQIEEKIINIEKENEEEIKKAKIEEQIVDADTNFNFKTSPAMNKDYANNWHSKTKIEDTDEEMEISWKNSCDNCNNKNQLLQSWNADWVRNVPLDSKWDNQNLRNIWNGHCNCLKQNIGRPPPSDQQLREDISQDGEQLLSDLSSLQQNYNEETLPTEIKFDLSSVFLQPLKERKRRHSFMANLNDDENEDEDGDSNNNEMNRSSWSFASRLEEDCLIQMSTLPTLRSVTL